MRSTPLVLVVVGMLAACGAPNVVPTPAPVVSEPPPPALPPPVDAHAEAVRAVARLRALADRDPVLAPWTGPYQGVPPWDTVAANQFPAAFALGIELLAAEIQVIATDPAPPTFTNTIARFEDAGRHLGRAEALFGVYTNNLKTPEVQAIEESWAPKLTAAADAVTFKAPLWARVESVWAQRAAAGLAADEVRVVQLLRERSRARGAQLDAATQARLGAINGALQTAFAEFDNRMLADEDTWIVVDQIARLRGMPREASAAMASAAAERGLAGKWIIVNTRSVVDPVLTSADDRALREQVWRAFKQRGDNGDARDTNDLIRTIVRLRAERAQVLGYPSHAHWRMVETMAGTPDAAEALMRQVWTPAVAAVAREVAAMRPLARKAKPAITTIEPWDYLYLAEKVRQATYAIDTNELRNYFELEQMIAASFYMAERLYGLTFREVTGTVPVFHPDVRVWEVTEQGRFVGLFYGDYFARPGKGSGAWASDYRGREAFLGEPVAAVVSNNNNFVKAAPGAPVLISLDDARTLFHEFGHALDALLSEVRFPTLLTTPRDFVEYPSQVHEQWVLTRPILDRFAKHVRTGRPMPASLVAKVMRARAFNQGYETVEALLAMQIDMALHRDPTGIVDPPAFEQAMITTLGAPREVAMRHRLPHFGHLFTSDSYSAGYYSYLWSSVMDADTRQAFVEAGDPFAPAIAAALRRHILAPGNATDRATDYRAFRGRDPSVSALLTERGLLPPTQGR